MGKLVNLKRHTPNVIDMNNEQSLTEYRKKLVKRDIKLRKKYRRWRSFETGNALWLPGAMAFFSSCFVWLPGVAGAIMAGIAILSSATFVNAFIARAFVHKTFDIDQERKKILKQINEIDERKAQLKNGHNYSFNYLSNSKTSHSEYSSKDEYNARKSDDYDY